MRQPIILEIFLTSAKWTRWMQYQLSSMVNFWNARKEKHVWEDILQT